MTDERGEKGETALFTGEGSGGSIERNINNRIDLGDGDEIYRLKQRGERGRELRIKRSGYGSLSECDWMKRDES